MDTTAKGPGLYEFLIEAELQHYYNSIKNDLKIQNASQLKYVTEEDLYQLGMAKPEVRRLKKFFNKYFSQNYLSKFKKMLLPKKDDQKFDPWQGGSTSGMLNADEGRNNGSTNTVSSSSAPRVPNKHIISAESIVVNKELGMGEFGIVQQGVWTNDGDRIQVAIKCLSRERMQNNPIEFLKEAAIMHSIDHEHVVRLYGVVLDTDSLMLVTELAPLRSLLECLKEPPLRSKFPILTLCDFALQICDGMQYLEAKRLIHRDLAARNILVFSKNKVKISDFGLSRALGQGKDYYQTNFNVHLKLPIAWCAPECISYLRFTSASDVWAYGVTLWEMFSYGFQPWAALTGHQILEAIDEPNYQRLEQPECCPKEYFSLMLRCWAHDPAKRPRFSDLFAALPDCRPEQLQAVVPAALPSTNNALSLNTDADLPPISKKDWLQYRVGDIITVLDKGVNSSFWKGVLANGKTGLFNPTHMVAYIGTNLPTAAKTLDSFARTDSKYSSTRRKLRSEMISAPQGDFKHTGHVGLDGAFFGDLSFLGGNSNSQYSHLPRQVVTPYKPHEDLDQTPLLSSSTTAIANQIPSNPSHPFISSPILNESTNQGAMSLHTSDHIALSSRQLQQLSAAAGENPIDPFSTSKIVSQRSVRWQSQVEPPATDTQVDHEYHEISDEENLVAESPRFEKTFDFGPSLLDEMESMFRNFNSPPPSTPNSPLDHDGVNKCNELRELTSRLNNSNGNGHSHSSHKKKQATVKPISAHDQKILDSAIELATEITNRSMNDLESDPVPTTPVSPNKRKFSFRFPASSNNETENSKSERRHFSEEAQSIPDLQSTLTEEAQLAYESLVETPTPEISIVMTAPQFPRTRSSVSPSLSDNPLRMLRSGNFPVVKSRTKFSSNLTENRRTVRGSINTHRRSQELIMDSSCETEKVKIIEDSFPIVNEKRCDDIIMSRRDIIREQESLCNNKANCEIVNRSGEDERKSRTSSSDDSNCEDAICSQDVVDANRRLLSSHTEVKSDDNPIPLPPRDRTKVVQVSKTRHVRKHPLIIPASSIRRTLNKVNAVTPEEMVDPFDFSENRVQIVPDDETNIEPLYINRTQFRKLSNDDGHEFDAQSLCFEERIDSNLAALDEIRDYDDEFHETIKTHDSLSNHESDRITSLTEKKNNRGITMIDKHKHVNPSVGEGDEVEGEIVLRHKFDHVSCEDLLEFADARPSPRARGHESDEVRIMLKVLGSEVSTEQCLLSLEHSDWDVHKAIKLARLQNALKISVGNPFVDLATCNTALEANRWDMNRAESWIIAANQEGDITQV